MQVDLADLADLDDLGQLINPPGDQLQSDAEAGSLRTGPARPPADGGGRGDDRPGRARGDGDPSGCRGACGDIHDADAMGEATDLDHTTDAGSADDGLGGTEASFTTQDRAAAGSGVGAIGGLPVAPVAVAELLARYDALSATRTARTGRRR